MHTIKITPNLLFEYQCTSGKFIRFPNRIESKLLLPELECSKTLPAHIHIVCLFISHASPLIPFLHFFLTHLLPYLSFPLRIDPLRFQTGCREKRLNPQDFSFFVYILCCSYSPVRRAERKSNLVHFCLKI